MIKLEEKFSNYYKKLEEAILNERDYYSYEDEIDGDLEYGNASKETMAKLRTAINHDDELDDWEKKQLSWLTFDATKRENENIQYAKWNNDSQIRYDQNREEEATRFFNRHKKEFLKGDFSSLYGYSKRDNWSSVEYLKPLFRNTLTDYIIDKCNQFNIKAKKIYRKSDRLIEIEIERDRNKLSISCGSDNSRRDITIRDLYGNMFYYEASKVYNLIDLRAIDKVIGYINVEDYLKDISTVKTIFSDLSEKEVLSARFTYCDIEQQLADIILLSKEEKKARAAGINSGSSSSVDYEILLKNVREGAEDYNAQYKLDIYYKLNSDTDEMEEAQVTDTVWKNRKKKADRFYKNGELRPKNPETGRGESWAVTDGHIIFANAATAMRFNGWDYHQGNQLYDACECHYGTNPWQTAKWRYATSNEIASAKSYSNIE